MIWLPRSLAVRATLLLALIACGVTGSLGAYFFYSARAALTQHMDVQLVGRVEQLRRLVGSAQTLADLRQRPLLLDSMSDPANDILVLRRPGQAPIVDIGPEHLRAPVGLVPVPAGRALSKQDVMVVPQPGADAPVHWVSALAPSGSEGGMIEIVAAHPFDKEVTMIATNRNRVLWSALVAMLASTLLGYLVLRHGLQPLHRVRRQAALITPVNLGLRLDEGAAPSELRGMVVAMNAMLDRIGTGYAHLQQFSADLAHEIRTPIGALIGQTQVALNQARDPAEYQAVLESNLEELSRLSHIAQNILFLAQADHATLDIQRAPLQLDDELQKIAEYFEGPADERGMRLEVVASGTAHVDAALWRRAVNNLVLNAVRYGEPGSTVQLKGHQGEDGAIVTVENRGPAIPADQLQRLFDRFYRGDAARSRQDLSTGLGLAIVKAILGLHRGEATVSCPSRDSIRFRLRFPGPSDTAR